MRARWAHAASVTKMIAENYRRKLLRLDRERKPYLARFFLAAAALFFPSALRTCDGRFATVLFFLAAGRSLLYIFASRRALLFSRL
jgi:hypothetical protein